MKATVAGMREWVGEIRFSEAVEAKLRTKHNLTPSQVRAAVSCNAHDQAIWKRHPQHGWRLMLVGSDDEGQIEAYLRPIDREDGLWQCLTAWRV